NVPRVVADYSNFEITAPSDLQPIAHYYLPLPDKGRMHDLRAALIYTGSRPCPFMLPNGLKEILDYPTWLTQDDKINRFPLIEVSNWHSGIEKSAVLNFIKGNIQTFTPEVLASTRGLKNVVLWIDT